MFPKRRQNATIYGAKQVTCEDRAASSMTLTYRKGEDTLRHRNRGVVGDLTIG